MVESFAVPEIKTKLVVAELDKLGISDALIVTGERDQKLELSARNLPKVRVLAAAGLNVRDILAREHLILTDQAVSAITERLR